jgi:predicted nuclease of predicted toxin-antitoxin system
MKFIIDAQLPKSLSDFLNAAGFNSLHTLELPEMNRTGDNAITTKADIEGRIVVTKDADFLDSYLLFGRPAKLLLVKTGNIPNTDLLKLFQDNLDVLQSAFTQCGFVEMTRIEIITHK